MESKRIFLCGVGGQGIILASNILSEVCMEAGYDVKKSEVHGMSQRGGSVVSNVVYGEKVYSPLIGKGDADIILALEKLEGLRHLDYLVEGGEIIVNDYRIDPQPVAAGLFEYPENVIETIKELYPSAKIVKTFDKALELGDVRVMNTMLLGVLSKEMDIDAKVWEDVIKRLVKPKFVDMNIKAFYIGREMKYE